MSNIKWEDVKLGAILSYIDDYKSTSRKCPNPQYFMNAFTNTRRIPPAAAYAFVEHLEDESEYQNEIPIQITDYTFRNMLKHQDPSLFPNKLAICVDVNDYDNDSLWIYRHDDRFEMVILKKEDCIV